MVAATYWIQKTDFAVEEKISTVVDDAAIGVIEDAQSQEIAQKYAEMSFGGRITDQTFGLLLMATFGTDTVGAVETGVKDHVFTMTQSATHPTLTVVVNEPNATSSSSLSYGLSMIDSLNMHFEVGQWATWKATLTGNAPSTASSTVAFVAENGFNPQYCTVKLATTYAGLGAASAINARMVDITIQKNLEDDVTIGNLAAVNRYNKQLVVTGSIQLVYADRSYIDTIMLGDLVRAMRITAANTGVTIGTTSNPTLTIDLARCKIQEVARTDKNNDVMLQTIKFKAYYSVSDSLMIKATLRNTVTSAY